MSEVLCDRCGDRGKAEVLMPGKNLHDTANYYCPVCDVLYDATEQWLKQKRKENPNEWT